MNRFKTVTLNCPYCGKEFTREVLKDADEDKLFCGIGCQFRGRHRYYLGIGILSLIGAIISSGLYIFWPGTYTEPPASLLILILLLVLIGIGGLMGGFYGYIGRKS